MPGAEVRPVVVEVLVVLPDADNGRHQFDLARHARFVDTGLLAPLRGCEQARSVLVEPVAVEDGEIDLALLVCPHQRAQHRAVRQQLCADRTAAGVLVIAASELETEVELAVRIVFGFDGGAVRQRMERPGAFLFASGRVAHADFVVVLGARFQAFDEDPAGVVVGDSGSSCRAGTQGVRGGSVEHREFRGLRGSRPNTDGVRA